MRSEWRWRERKGREGNNALSGTELDVRDELRREDEPRRGDVVGQEKRREEKRRGEERRDATGSEAKRMEEGTERKGREEQ